MNRSVEIEKRCFGISITSEGEKVLTPFGFFGLAYEYRSDSYLFFRRSMYFLLYLTALIISVEVLASILRYLSFLGMLGTVVLSIIIFDVIRFLMAKVIFRRATKLKVWSPSVRMIGNIPDRRYDLLFFLKPQYFLYIFIIMDAVFALNLIDDILNRNYLLKDGTISLIISHALIYAALYLKVRQGS